MKSLKELYKIGRGPSSSHTMGPEKAARAFLEAFGSAVRFEVTLYGSLAKTGKGHMTDRVLMDTLKKPTLVFFDTSNTDIKHPNTMDMRAYDENGVIGSWRVYSIGGGAISIEGEAEYEPPEVYNLNSFNEVSDYVKARDMRFPDYVVEVEGEEILDFLSDIWQTMKSTIKAGIKASGIIEGGLSLQRKAKFLYNQRHIDESPETRENRLVCAYAFATSEQNASANEVVTAPTCGSSGVLPAVLKYMQDKKGLTDDEIVRALATAGLIGNIIKTNASISGAECGCQSEIGSACSMAAAALCELFDMDIDQIEYAAEVAMEHHLGLTCDPILGLVQIPCIERNAVAAMRAINALSLANFLTYTRKISFDMVVATMYETGKDLPNKYRETSEGGLAKKYK